MDTTCSNESRISIDFGRRVQLYISFDEGEKMSHLEQSSMILC